MAIGRIGFNELPQYGNDLEESLLRAMAARQSRNMFPEKLREAQLGNQETELMMPVKKALMEAQGRKTGLEAATLAEQLPYVAESTRTKNNYLNASAWNMRSPAHALSNLGQLGKAIMEPAILRKIAQYYGIPVPEDQKGQQNVGPNMQDAQPVNGGQQGYSQNNAQDNHQTGTSLPFFPSQGELDEMYDQKRLKMNTDTDTRKRNLFATNIEKTLSYVDPDALTQYGGLKGQIKLRKEQALAPFEKQSSEYDKYMKSLNAVKLMTKQIRQFYGDSIQPNVQENLEKLNNPATWAVNPKLAKQLFNQTKDILENELGTYRDALKTTRAYQDTPAPTKKSIERELIQKAEKADNGNIIEVIGPQGQMLRGPAEKLDAFLKAHPNYRRK